MNYFYDFEFIEKSSEYPIIPLSIGMVSEDGREYYREFPESSAATEASDWLIDNVYPHLIHYNNRCDSQNCCLRERVEVAEELVSFLQLDSGNVKKKKPRLWGYYSAYDHVCFAQLWDTMTQMPKGIPYFTRDIKQYGELLGIYRFPRKSGVNHNALDDAKWTKDVYDWLLSQDNLTTEPTWKKI